MRGSNAGLAEYGFVVCNMLSKQERELQWGLEVGCLDSWELLLYSSWGMLGLGVGSIQPMQSPYTLEPAP